MPSTLLGEKDRKTSDNGSLGLQACAWHRMHFLRRYLWCVQVERASVAAHSVILAVYLLHVRHHASLACMELLSNGRRRDKQIHTHKMSFGDSATEKNKIGYKGMESNARSVCNFRR